MKAIMTELYAGCMRGRTMYVVPYCLGPLGRRSRRCSEWSSTDSPYVVASMHIMTRMGSKALSRMGEDADFVPGCTAWVRPLDEGERGRPWPCNPTKYISHFPRSG
jgi:phosphoenolpyruvate carboxykinase (GTP)